MSTQPDIRKFLRELEKFAHRPLNFPVEMEQILELVKRHGTQETFREAIFQAKFAVKTREIMARIGEQGDGYGKLSSEFQKSLERTSILLKSIVEPSEEYIKESFKARFFALRPESFVDSQRLLEDLGCVKNWEIDGRALPFGGEPVPDVKPAASESDSVANPARRGVELAVRIRNGSIVGCLLMGCVFFIDPPVTVVGWTIMILVTLLFLSFVAMAHALIPKL